MTTIRILNYPDPKLKRTAVKVTNIDSSIKKIISDMFATHYATKNCAALAATQLDLPDPVPHITVIDFSDKKNQPLCLINAEIVAAEGEHSEQEGCMSVYPDYIYASVTRATNISVQYLDETGQQCSLEAKGFMAKCIQHELDHLNGKVFLDHLSRIKRERLDKKIDKLMLRLN